MIYGTVGEGDDGSTKPHECYERHTILIYYTADPFRVCPCYHHIITQSSIYTNFHALGHLPQIVIHSTGRLDILGKG